MDKLEYLTHQFDTAPTAEELNKNFGSKGWLLTFIVPVQMPGTVVGVQGEMKLLGYFARPTGEPI